MSHLSWGEPDQAGCTRFSTQGWRGPDSVQHSKVSAPSSNGSQTNIWRRGCGGRFRVTDSRFLFLRTGRPCDQVYTSESRSTPVEECNKLVEIGFLEIPIENSGAKDGR